MKRFLAALVLIIPLSGCNTLAHVIGGDSIADTAPATVAEAEKALTLAHLAYDGLGDTLKATATSGVLHGPAAATAKTYYDKAGDALLLADQADATANAKGIMDAISSADTAILQAKNLAGVK